MKNFEKDVFKKFLLVDDDPEFASYFSVLLGPYNIMLDICHTLQIAREKINSSLYDAYIIDLNLPDGSGLDLIEEIRNKKENKNPIVAISGIFRDEKMFKLLRDKYLVDYILDKPIYPHQLDKLLVDLCTSHKIESSDPSNIIEKLKQEYLKTISDKIILLTELVKTVQKIPDRDSLTALRNAVHKIAGSAGSYGFAEVSVLCKELESHIREQLASPKTIQKEWLSSLDVFMSKVKFYFQFTTLKDTESASVKPTSIERPSLYIVDADVKFLDLLQKEKGEFNIDLFVESSPEKALARLRSTEFNPRIIVFSQTFFGSSINALDLMEAVKNKQQGVLTLFCILLEEDSIAKRVEAVKNGIDYIFQKPISAQALLQAMTEELELRSLRDFKVLILDDDPDTCSFISFALSEIGIESRSVEHPSSLYQAIEEYSPNLLFLDIFLPNHDGFELLKILRADMVHRHLLIVMITAQIQEDTQLKSYLGSADDILYKPLDKRVLQKCVLNLAKRTALLGYSTVQVRIGLNTFKTLLKKLRELLISTQFSSAYLALFRIDQYADLVLNEGYNKVNELIILISNLLQGLENSMTSCYFSGTSTFGILFTAGEAKVIEDQMLALFDSIQRKSPLSLSFSSSIVPVSREVGDDNAIIHEAEKGLKEAQNKDFSPTKIVTHEPGSGAVRRKTLILVEPSEDLSMILKRALTSQYLTVKVFNEGKIALQELLKCNEVNVPSLLIIERKLPDMDGIEILKSLHTHFKSPIPVYFLTDFAAEKDVSEGLELGALEYITKPFSLSLLVQKVMKVIFGKRH